MPEVKYVAWTELLYNIAVYYSDTEVQKSRYSNHSKKYHVMCLRNLISNDEIMVDITWGSQFIYLLHLYCSGDPKGLI